MVTSGTILLLILDSCVYFEVEAILEARFHSLTILPSFFLLLAAVLLIHDFLFWLPRPDHLKRLKNSSFFNSSAVISKTAL
jgi:hypothetical protein